MPLPTRANRAFFDLAHLDTLSGEPGHCLFVSPKTLYILQNLVVADVLDLTRYAVAMLDCGWYIPCQKWSPEYGQVAEIQEGIEREVVQMPCYGFIGEFSTTDFKEMTETIPAFFSYEVPENELWEVQSVGGYIANRASSMQFYIVNADESPGGNLFYKGAAAANEWHIWSGKAVLVAGQKVGISIFSSQSGDYVGGSIHVGKLALQ